MDHPIRPGTARRLGLNPPPFRPGGIVGRQLTDEEKAARSKGFRDQWIDERNRFGLVEIQHVPRRRWWHRKDRSSTHRKPV
ncbi:hypothetical protein DMC63_01355 [Streptomyces sp. WAC 05977]|nr:hypothetical protein DMC63_01355 [Streptomyces sp. WAC 05977]